MSAREIHVSELVTYCNSLTRNTMKDHEKRFTERVKGIREAAINLSNAAARFASAVRSAWGTLDKTTSEYGIRLAHIIQESALEISTKEMSSSYQETAKFFELSVQISNEIIHSMRKYVPKLYRGLRTEMATLNTSLAKLENSIKALGTALDQSPGAKLESLHREVEQIMQKHADLLKLRSQEQNEATILQAFSERESKIVSEKESLLCTPEFTELKRYEEALRLKGDEIRQFLQPLTKPLLKLERMASVKQTSVNTLVLRNLIDRPTETVVASQSFPVTQLLIALEEKLNQRALEFEEKRRRRAHETINAVRGGAMEKMREEYLALQANVQETMRQLKSKEFLGRRDALEGLLAEKQAQIEESSGKKRELDRKIDDLTRAILKQKATIESQVSAITDRSISILTD